MATTESEEVLTSDSMRKVVEEEGLEAKNLLNWNVIVNEKGSLDVPKTSKKPPLSPRPQSASPKPPFPAKENETRLTKRCSSLRHPKNRVRSSSVGRNPEKSLRARYWAFLFENLYRAVDEIYQTCEVDESIVESKEAIMMLENYCKEFQALIQWLNISKNYEVTQPLNRPTSLAWDVRKSLPSKSLLRTAFLDKIGGSGNGPRKKFDFHGELVYKTTAVQTQFEKNVLENATLATPNCKHSANDEKNDNVIADQNLEVVSNVVNPIIGGNKNCNDNIATNHVEVDIKSNVDLNTVNNNHHQPSSPTVLGFDTIEKIEIATVKITEKCEIVSEAGISFLDHSDLLISIAAESDINESDSTDSVKDQNLVIEQTESDLNTPSNLSGAHDKEIIECGHVGDAKSPVEECEEKQDTKEFDDQQLSMSTDIEDLNVNQEVENSQLLLPNKESEGSCMQSDIKLNDTSEKEIQTVDVCESSSLTLLSENNRQGELCIDEAAPSTSQVQTSEIGVQTVPIEGKGSSVTLSKFSAGSKAKFLVDAKSVANKKPVISTQISRSLTSKNPQTTSSPQTSIQNNSPNISPPNKEVTRRVSLVSSRLAKTAVNSATSAKNVNATGPVKPTIQKKTNLNVPTQELRPFRTGNYEPKIRCASHVVTPPIAYRKFGNKKAPDAIAPSHTSRPSQHHIGKDSIKSGSTSSLSSTSSVKSWIGKVKEKSSDMTGEAKHGGNPDSTDDADGWETVRGRARCKNSPAKKLVATQNALDTAIAAKLSQCKMGGFVYNCTSNSQPVIAVKPVKTSKDPLEDETSPELPTIKKSKVSSKTPCTSYLKSKPDCANNVKKLSESKGIVENSKNRKQVSVNSELAIGSDLSAKNKSGSFRLDGKQLPKKCSIQRQCSSDNLKQNKAVNLMPPLLTKSYSSCSMDVRKKEKHSLQKVTNLEKLKLTRKPQSPIKLDTLKVHDAITDTSKCVPKENSASQNQDIRDDEDESSKEFTSSQLLLIHDREIDANSLLQKSEEISSNDSSDLYEGLISEDTDGINSHDEGLTEAQELEMYEKMIAEEAQEHISSLGLSWGDQMDLLDMELRTPGRATQMHEKLSSPFRKRPLSETIRLHEEKQLKAQEQRERLLEEKAQHFKDIQKKVEEMKVLNEKKAERQRIILEQKLQRAEEKRKKQIEMIVRKAHDEEEKVNEIAFINTLEAQNKRHDLISKEKDHEARLHDIQEERQRKLEEKAAKEAAAEERRKVLEAERQARLLEMQEKRKLRDLKIEQQLMEKEKERQELANQKARDRELRKSALNAAQQATVEELQKKIQLKQEESARRHEENIELIRQKAFELSVRRYSSNNDDVPQLVPYPTKKICTICNVLIGSEVYLLSHLRGKKHQAMIADQHQDHDPSTEELELYNLKHIVDASTDQLDPNIALDKERQKALKKRCKKLRQKLEKRGLEFEKYMPKKLSSPTKKIRMQKLISEIRKFSTNEASEICDDLGFEGLEKALTDVASALDRYSAQDKTDFCILGGVSTMLELLNKITVPSLNINSLVPNKTAVQIFEVVESMFNECYENCGYLLLSNKFGLALDILSQRLNVLIPDNFTQIILASSPSNCHIPLVDELAKELIHYMAFVLHHLSSRDLTLTALTKAFSCENDQNMSQRLETQVTDIVSYAVSIGIVDRFSQYFNNVRGPVDSKPEIAGFLQCALVFLTALMKLYYNCYDSTLERKKTDDSTQFIATLKVTELVGAVSLLYCILLHDGSSPMQETPPLELPKHTIVVTIAAFRLLNQVAVMNLHLVQSILGSEGLSLQLRHIASYLLWYCNHWKEEILLHELILLLGYFTVSNLDNQVLIQAGQCPTVLQQLCALPFVYFSKEKHTEVLFPTLLACCYNNECNKVVLQQEMAMELLSTYLETKILDGYSMNLVKTDPNIRWCLHTRFPKYQWSSAKLYFSK